MEDNATCIRAPPVSGPFGPPGFGGAYAGSKTRCAASHDLRDFAQPEACQPRNGGPPFQPGTSFAGFDEFPSPSGGEPYDWLKAEWKRKR